MNTYYFVLCINFEIFCILRNVCYNIKYISLPRKNETQMPKNKIQNYTK